MRKAVILSEEAKSLLKVLKDAGHTPKEIIHALQDGEALGIIGVTQQTAEELHSFLSGKVPALLNSREVAEEMMVSRNNVGLMVKRGQLKPALITGEKRPRHYFRRTDIEALLYGVK